MEQRRRQGCQTTNTKMEIFSLHFMNEFGGKAERKVYKFKVELKFQAELEYLGKGQKVRPFSLYCIQGGAAISGQMFNNYIY
jgi:hypothetical protein